MHALEGAGYGSYAEPQDCMVRGEASGARLPGLNPYSVSFHLCDLRQNTQHLCAWVFLLTERECLPHKDIIRRS